MSFDMEKTVYGLTKTIPKQIEIRICIVPGHGFATRQRPRERPIKVGVHGQVS